MSNLISLKDYLDKGKHLLFPIIKEGIFGEKAINPIKIQSNLFLKP